MHYARGWYFSGGWHISWGAQYPWGGWLWSLLGWWPVGVASVGGGKQKSCRAWTSWSSNTTSHLSMMHAPAQFPIVNCRPFSKRFRCQLPKECMPISYSTLFLLLSQGNEKRCLPYNPNKPMTVKGILRWGLSANTRTLALERCIIIYTIELGSPWVCMGLNVM